MLAVVDEAGGKVVCINRRKSWHVEQGEGEGEAKKGLIPLRIYEHFNRKNKYRSSFQIDFAGGGWYTGNAALTRHPESMALSCAGMPPLDVPGGSGCLARIAHRSASG